MRNCLVFFLEALRYDSVSHGSSSEEDQGNHGGFWLDKLKEKGVSLKNLRSTHLSAEPSLASLLTGLYPWEHHLYGKHRSLNSRINGLSESFNREGYRTILCSGRERHGPNGIAACFDEWIQGSFYRIIRRIKNLNAQGISTFIVYDCLDLTKPYLLSHYPPDQNYHQEALQFARELSSRCSLGRNFKLDDAHSYSEDWKVPLVSSNDMPLWSFFEEHLYGSSQRVNLQNRSAMLRDLYWSNIELIDKYHFKALHQFINNDEIGKQTTVILTSNSGHSELGGKSKNHFGQPEKPTEDAVRVPGLFLNSERIDEKFETTTEKTVSHLDLFPTILDEFNIGSGPRDCSGRSILLDNDTQQRYFISLAEKGLDAVEHESFDSPGPAVISFCSILREDGYKLYRRGLPIEDHDYNRSLFSFFRVLGAKLLTEWFSTTEIQKRVDDFKTKDSRQLRRELAQNLLETGTSNETAFYTLKNDPGEHENLLDKDTVEYTGIVEELLEVLEEQFDDPYRLETPTPVRRTFERISTRPPLEPVGYLE